MKVAINRCYGGFGLSRKAWFWLREHGLKEAIDEPLVVGETWSDGSVFLEEHDQMWGNSRGLSSTKRNDPLLIECLETLGEEASGEMAKLKIVEIPDGIDYEIDEYDGMERIEEIHRSWT